MDEPLTLDEYLEAARKPLCDRPLYNETREVKDDESSDKKSC